jgi:hypothetical protein
MFSFRGPIIMPALVAVVLLTAVMLWQRGTHDSPLKDAAIQISAVDAPSAQPPTAPVAAVQAAQPAPEQALAVPANDAAAPSAADPQQMPVQIIFRRRERLNKFEGRITNTSGDPLQVEVLVLSASTHYTTQAGVNVGGYLQSSFGIDDGLDMQSGDQVTLRSYPYHDSVIQIP